MKKVITFIGLALLLSLCATPVYAIPVLPHAFYGSVFINDDPAPVGTTVEAKGTGVRTGIEGNPIIVTEAGQYGGPGGLDPKLVVQGDIPSGATITFYVTDENGTAIGDETATFKAGGGPTRHDLFVTIAVPARRYGEAAPAPAPTVETNLFGIEGSFRISDEGEILATITATSADGNLIITITEGTIALDKDGEPLSSLTADVDPSPPPPPEDAHIIGLAYDFGPDGATFEPPITFTWSYDPDALPEGVAEEDLVIAYYDEAADEWVEVDCVVDTENNIITASVEHFTTFAIIGTVTPLPPPPPPAPAAFSLSNLSIQPLEVEPREAVTVTVSVANTGGTEGSYSVVLKINGVKEAEKSVTITAGGSEIVAFSVTREEAGSYSVTVDGLSASFTIVAPPPPPPPPPEEEEIVPVPAPPNWPLIGGIIAAVVVVALLIYFLVVRRRAY